MKTANQNNDQKHSRANARANILAKLKSQVKGADYDKLPDEESYTYPKRNRAEQLDLFVSHLVNNHAQVIKLEQADIARTVADELNKREIDKLLYGENSQYSQDVEKLACEINLNSYDFCLDQNKEKLFNHYPASITGSYGIIAHTGSIILWPTIEEPRTLSLVPPVHFVIVDADKLYPTFDDVMATEHWQNKLPTNVVLVSGPSKTADIQQTLAYGAHGPKELIVLLLNGE